MISSFSTGAFTDEKTGSIIIPILHWLLPTASRPTLLLVHHFIRKSAHFVEYFVFSILVLRSLRAGHRDEKLSLAVAAILIVAGYASLDEWHQSFVPGRTPRVADVLLDTTGGVTAQLLTGLGYLAKRRKTGGK